MDIDPQLISLAKTRNPDGLEGEPNQLIEDLHFEKIDTPTGCPAADNSKHWFPTPETGNEISIFTPLQKDFRIINCNFSDKIKWILKNNDADLLGILEKLPWDIGILNADQKSQLEEFLVENHDAFAKHCFEEGYYRELKIKLKPKYPLPVYVQGPPAEIHLRYEILIELALINCLIL